jgi:hypothetical protein
MERETINRVEILDTGELLLGLESQGKSMYQYVYREAAGVYWDEQRHGFKSTPMKEWPCSKWFFQIIGVVKSGLGVELNLGPDITWRNIPAQERAIIENGKII